MRDDANPLSTKFEYLYRDASNYKAFGHVLLEGVLSVAEREEIIARLEGGEFFIAEQIGVPTLYEMLYESTGGPTASDHCWHEFDQLSDEVVIKDGDRIWGSVEELLAKFRSVRAWDLRLSPHFELMYV